MNGSSYVKILLISSAILNIENDDKHCFLWSISAIIHSFENSHPNRVSNYRQSFNELNIQGFNSTNGFESSFIQKFEKLNNFSINIFELGSYQDPNNWKHKLLSTEISRSNSDRVVDLLI